MMKHFTLIAAGIASVAALSAQRPANGGQTLLSAPIGSITAEKADSNLLPGSFTSGTCNSLYLISSVGTSGNDSVPGFVFGVNAWFDLAKGYKFNGNGTIPGIGVSTAVKFKLDTAAANTGGYYKAYVYNGTTGQLLGSSDSVLYANIDTVPGQFGPFPITPFTFSTPVAVSGDFYVFVDAFSRTDTSSGIGILSNGYACGDDKSYEIFTNQNGGLSVSKISSYWKQPGTTTPLLADPFIAVQVQNFLGETEMLTPSSLMAYPNPANETTVFSFHSNAEGTAQIEIRNLAGQLVSATSADVMNGRNEVSISLTNMSNGVYSYHVTVGGETKTGKLVVNH
jgi:hypothetical protein